MNLVAYQEMPQPDELIELCKGIHTLRAQGKLKDEIQMFKVRYVGERKNRFRFEIDEFICNRGMHACMHDLFCCFFVFLFCGVP